MINPVEYQVPLPDFVVEHMALTKEIINAMMTTEADARGVTMKEEPHGRPGT